MDDFTGTADCLAPVPGAQVARNRFGEYVIARHWYATPEACEASSRAVGLLLWSPAARSAFPAKYATNTQKWLFLDTEATGFIGGDGNLAFLIGLAWWEAGGIQIEQLFMRDPSEEYAVLLELRRRMRKRPVLVTFNGKSFDWPLLMKRFQMTRIVDAPILDAHLDFLHPAREIWKLQIGKVKLGNLEERILQAESPGWSRREDIDSGLIPGIYFDYVRGAGASAVEAVFRHNRMDLRGLAALAAKILRIASIQELEPTETGSPALESYGVARFFAKRGRHTLARHYFESALEQGLPAAIDEQARRELAKIIRRELRATNRASRERRRITRCAGSPARVPNGWNGR